MRDIARSSAFLDRVLTMLDGDVRLRVIVADRMLKNLRFELRGGFVALLVGELASSSVNELVTNSFTIRHF